MRFHVVNLAHTSTTKEFVWCAYTEKVRKFCNMMKSLGHTVFLYGGTCNEALCDEFISCITCGKIPDSIIFDRDQPHWKIMNTNVINEIGKRRQHKDFICIIGGGCQKQIADAFPNLMSVEYGVGYSGVFSKFRVFESYAWMHSIYNSGDDGKFYDAVIPNYFEVDDFPYVESKSDYFLFIGRLVHRKGYMIAYDICKKLNLKLIIAGKEFDKIPNDVEYRGVVGAKERGELMSNAKAVFVPTLYLEPFGGVAVEAMLCGTPVITTDWGAFTETVLHGKTGFRCRTMEQFIWATRNIDQIKPIDCRNWASQNYSTDRVKYMYDEYFKSLLNLWDNGWYQTNDGRSELNWLNKYV